MILFIYRLVLPFFGDPRRLFRALIGTWPFLTNLITYIRHQNSTKKSFRFKIGKAYPQLSDRFESAGTACGHYFHQDIWAARLIHSASPEKHIDIGSRIDGFVAHLLAFMDVTEVDIRPLNTSQPGLTFVTGDMLDLPFPDQSMQSLSCLHALEHVGLGRYGDPIDPNAWTTAITQLQRVLAPDGKLYFSVPIGSEKLEFNAHRIFDPLTITDSFDQLQLVSFSAVSDDGDFVENALPDDYRNSRYACGLFEFQRPQ